MIKYTALILILATRITFHPLHTTTENAPFTNQLKVQPAKLFVNPANFINVEGNLTENKFKINWNVNDNESADKFEVEKSIDGKYFKMAALVFATDKKNIDHYQFYEKATNKKTFYRIKLVNKNKEIIYSKLIEINSAI